MNALIIVLHLTLIRYCNRVETLQTLWSNIVVMALCSRVRCMLVKIDLIPLGVVLILICSYWISTPCYIELFELMLRLCVLTGAQLHRCVLGQMYREAELKTGLAHWGVPCELCWTLHWHHTCHHEPLHTDGAKGHTLSTLSQGDLSRTSGLRSC